MTARLLLDEMYPPALAGLLRDRGHDVVAVAGHPELAGSPDEAILDAATSGGRCLVTENVRDFAALARYTGHGGLLFVSAERLPRTPAAIKRLADALDRVITAGGVPGPGEAGWLS
jgi:predicted nuclease of predicted toxin-antitoxin system